MNSWWDYSCPVSTRETLYSNVNENRTSGTVLHEESKKVQNLRGSGKPYLTNVKIVLMKCHYFSGELFIVTIRVFCPKAGLSLQTQAPRHQTLKDQKRSQEPQYGGEESEFG